MKLAAGQEPCHLCAVAASSSGERGRQEPVRVSRVTKRPRRRAARGVRQAQELVRRLTQPEWRQRAQLTERQMRMLDRIADGRPPRHAAPIIRAICEKIDHAYEKPRLGVDVTVKSHAQLVAEAAGLLEAEVVKPEAEA